MYSLYQYIERFICYSDAFLCYAENCLKYIHDKDNIQLKLPNNPLRHVLI